MHSARYIVTVVRHKFLLCKLCEECNLERRPEVGHGVLELVDVVLLLVYLVHVPREVRHQPLPAALRLSNPVLKNTLIFW